jgi:oxygen-independent coproporphyrinogen-3 oxidase
MTLPIYAEPRAAYLHVPFCAHRCGYCDFTLVAGRDDLADDYLRAMSVELTSLEHPRDVDTVFFGGGTPTHLPPKQLAGLLELTRKWFVLAPGYEWSVEANPFGLSDEKIELLADAGVNRISLGVQSFDTDVLKLLERDHRAEEVVSAVERIRRRIENVGLDLIFGVPGQSFDLWRETLSKAIKLKPTHLSTYGLTFEKGTAFWTRREKGALAQLPDELERDMYAATMSDLAAAGFEHYEISNFARPGFRCRHNQTYWQAIPYFGFGPGAARYINGVRSSNHRSTTTWIKRVLAGERAIGMTEELEPEHRAREALVLGLRQLKGVRRDRFQQLTGFDLDELAGSEIARQLAAKNIEDFGDGIRLSQTGIFLADSVIVDFL